jgi:hypothetical protein
MNMSEIGGGKKRNRQTKSLYLFLKDFLCFRVSLYLFLKDFLCFRVSLYLFLKDFLCFRVSRYFFVPQGTKIHTGARSTRSCAKGKIQKVFIYF